jgi:hypothetical protein
MILAWVWGVSGFRQNIRHINYDILDSFAIHFSMEVYIWRKTGNIDARDTLRR